MAENSKLDMALDDVIQSGRKNRGGRGGGRGGRGGQGRGGQGGGQGRGGWQQGGGRGGQGRGGGGRGGRGNRSRYIRSNGNRSDRSGPYDRPQNERNRPSSDEQWIHDKYDTPQKGGRNAVVINTKSEVSHSGPVKLTFEGLPFDVLEDEAKDVFASYGQCSLELFYDRDRSLGKGQVIFENRADSLKALDELDGALVNGSVLSVSLGPNSGTISGKKGASGESGGEKGAKSDSVDDSLVISVQNDRADRSRKGRGPFRFGTDE